MVGDIITYLKDSIPIAVIKRRVISKFPDTDSEQIKNDIDELIEQLISLDIIEIIMD